MSGPGSSRRNQRRHERRRAGFEVTISVPGGPSVPGNMSLDAGDLSEGGAFLHAQLLFEEGEVLTLDIPLPSGKTINVTGRVARVNRDAEGDPGMGIEFLTLQEGDRRILSANLKRLMGAPK